MPAAAAWIVPSIVGAAGVGASVYSANKSANAAKEAAKTQAASGQQALDVERDIYNQTRADLAPYRGVGASAITTLGSLMGLPASGGADAATGTAKGNLNTKLSASAVRTGPNGTGWVPATAGAKWYPGDSDVAGSGWPPQTVNPYQERTTSSYGGPVAMRAPDGTQQEVPGDQVAHFLSRGATIVRA